MDEVDRKALDQAQPQVGIADPAKRVMLLRLDPDVADWAKSKGDDLHAQINMTLRNAMRQDRRVKEDAALTPEDPKFWASRGQRNPEFWALRERRKPIAAALISELVAHPPEGVRFQGQFRLIDFNELYDDDPDALFFIPFFKGEELSGELLDKQASKSEAPRKPLLSRDYPTSLNVQFAPNDDMRIVSYTIYGKRGASIHVALHRSCQVTSYTSDPATPNDDKPAPS